MPWTDHSTSWSPNSYSFLSTAAPRSGQWSATLLLSDFSVFALSLLLSLWMPLVYLSLRSHAIACVNQFIIGRAQALMDNIDTFIEVSAPELCFDFITIVFKSNPTSPHVSLFGFKHKTHLSPLSEMEYIKIYLCVKVVFWLSKHNSSLLKSYFFILLTLSMLCKRGEIKSHVWRLLLLTLPILPFSLWCPESVCAGRWWGQWSTEECVQGSGHAAGSPHWPPHPTHAQHHPGEAGTWAHKLHRK